MNLYDKKIIKCVKCQKQIGEIDIGTNVVYSICKNCENKQSSRKPVKKEDSIEYSFLNKRMIETIKNV